MLAPKPAFAILLQPQANMQQDMQTLVQCTWHKPAKKKNTPLCMAHSMERNACKQTREKKRLGGSAHFTVLQYCTLVRVP